MKKILKKIFRLFNIDIRKVPPKNVKKKKVVNHEQLFTMKGGIQRSLKRGLEVNTVIDVGASDGRWSRECMEDIPNANFLLVEAQSGHLKGLQKIKEEKSNVDFVLAAAGKENGKIYFDNSGLFSGLATETKINENCIEVPVVSLDSEVKNRNLKPPYLLKLDTHGYEVPILEGAKEILEKASLVIIETYNYKLTDDSLRYFEMCDYMEKLGFSSVEMVDFMLRKHDNSFWQMDTFFVPTSNKEFSYNSYE